MLSASSIMQKGPRKIDISRNMAYTVSRDDPRSSADPGTLIRRGHRPWNGSYLTCLCSACQYHNESCNVWTHMLPFLYFLRYALQRQGKAGIGRSLPRAVAGAAAALFCGSAAAHLFCAHSPRARDVLFRLDRALIAVYGASVSLACGWLHFTPRREFRMRAVYSAAIIAACIRTTTATVMSDRSAEQRGPATPTGTNASSSPSSKATLETGAGRLRQEVLLYVLQYGLGFVAVVRQILLEKDTKMVCDLAKQALGAAISALAGACFHVMKFPEAKFPETFDLIGSSHNIFHVLTANAVFHSHKAVRDWARYLRKQQPAQTPKMPGDKSFRELYFE